MHIIADNIQITNPVIARALGEMDPLPVQDLEKNVRQRAPTLLISIPVQH